MIEKLGTCASLHGKNDFAERAKVFAGYRSENNILHNYFDSSTKLL